MKIIDLSGKRFGRWLVVSLYGPINGSTMWDCICDCGTEKMVNGSSLRKGVSFSCGCLSREITSKVKYKHGLHGTLEYATWARIKDRCGNPKNNRYHRYGGRGIKVCGRWLNSFENFYADMGKKPSPKHSIDRINNDGDYEPGNCRWATAREQAQNKNIAKNNKSGCTGVTRMKGRKKWRAALQRNGERIELGYFSKKQEAINAIGDYLCRS